MYRKTVVAHLLSIVLASAFLIGSLPMPNHMFSMRMDKKMVSEMAVSQTNIAPKNFGDNSTGTSGTCCDAIGSFSLVCDFIATQFARVIVYGGSERVVNSASAVQSIYIKAASPPPKA